MFTEIDRDRLREAVKTLRDGEKLSLAPNGYIRKHGREYSLNDLSNKHRNRWGNLDEIADDGIHYMTYGNLPAPHPGGWW